MCLYRQYGIFAQFGDDEFVFRVGQVVDDTFKFFADAFNLVVGLVFEESPDSEEPVTVYYDEKEDVYVAEGPRVEKMLGYTNLDSEKGFQFFQNFLRTSGILEKLEALGIEEGDTVRMYDLHFDYYK